MAAGWHDPFACIPAVAGGVGCKRGEGGRGKSSPRSQAGPPGAGHPAGCPNTPGGSVAAPRHGPRRWARSQFGGHSAWGCPGPGRGRLWGDSGAGGGGRLAGGQHSSGCRPVSSSRGNKLRPKGAFEHRAPCGAGVLLWQPMLDPAPPRGGCAGISAWRVPSPRHVSIGPGATEPVLSRSLGEKPCQERVSDGNECAPTPTPPPPASPPSLPLPSTTRVLDSSESIRRRSGCFLLPAKGTWAGAMPREKCTFTPSPRGAGTCQQARGV